VLVWLLLLGRARAWWVALPSMVTGLDGCALSLALSVCDAVSNLDPVAWAWV